MATLKSGRRLLQESDLSADLHEGKIGPALRPRRKYKKSDNSVIWQDATSNWDTWVSTLLQRKKPIALRKLLPSGGKSSLLWATEDNVDPSSIELIAKLDKLRIKQKDVKASKGWTQRVSDWLAANRLRREGNSASSTTLGYALECLAWAHGLPLLVGKLSEGLWTELAETLVRISSEASNGAFPREPIVGQLIAGELPLTLSYLFPELPRCVELNAVAREVIAEGIDEILDGEGQPHARHLPQLRLILACWTRCLYLDRMLKKQRIEKPARLQFEWLVRQTLRWCRRDGTSIFDQKEKFKRASFLQLMDSALCLAGDQIDLHIMDALISNPNETDGADDSLPSAAEHSDWAETAMLRTNWNAKSDYFAVTYHGRELNTEFAINGKVAWSGQLQPRVSFDGQVLTPQSDWEEVCWESDYDVNYLELEMEFGQGCSVQRQILMARGDRFLMISDALTNLQTGRHEIVSRLPLAKNISLKPSDETHEAFLMNGSKRMASVMPISLPEWRTDRNRGQINTDRNEFTQFGQGSGMYSSLFIDFEPTRQRFPLTWRQLTVAESLEILTPDTAVAFRVQVGKRQWVIYRSIADAGNRTFLGHNLIAEFVVARFDPSGELTNLIEIE